jgi:hypothetical protein
MDSLASVQSMVKVEGVGSVLGTTHTLGLESKVQQCEQNRNRIGKRLSNTLIQKHCWSILDELMPQASI